MLRSLSVVLVACGTPHVEPRPRANTQVDVEPPPAADAAQRIAAGSKKWLAGDLDGAISELERAGGDPSARGMLARAYGLIGRADDARRTAERALGGARPTPRLLTDVSKIEQLAVSPDGAYFATTEPGPRYGVAPTVTVWSTVSGRDLFTANGESVEFGVADGEMRAAILAREPGELRVVAAASGTERWKTKTGNRTWDIAIDRHGTLTTIGAPSSTLIQWDLATGAKKREITNTSNAAVMSMSADGTTVLAASTLLDLGPKPTKIGELPPSTMSSGIGDRVLGPDGQLIATARRDGSVTIDGRDGRLRARLAGAGGQIAFLDDGTLITTDGERVSRWTGNGDQLGTFELPARIAPMNRLVRIAIGAGGHLVVHTGRELVALTITRDKLVALGTMGLATRATTIVWSDDGAKLAISGRGDVAVWSVGGVAIVPGPHPQIETLGFDSSGKVAINAPITAAPMRLELVEKRVFVHGGGRVQRFVEARELIVDAETVGDQLVGAGDSGTLYFWNANTGEGLGEIKSDARVTTIALRGDGRTLAVARARGGVELWDLPSRTLMLSVATWVDGGLIVTPTGRFDGNPLGLAWDHRTGTFPGTSTSKSERRVADSVLASRPPPIAIRPTPAASIPARECVPADVDPTPITATLANTTLAFCLRQSQQDDPYCFEVDIVTRVAKAVPPALDVVAPTPDGEPPKRATVERVGGSVKVCPVAGACRTFAVNAAEEAPLGVSDDGTLVAIGEERSNFVETWNVATGTRIARFKVRYGIANAADGFGRSLGFWEHNVLAINTPCAGPCGEATMYDVRGKLLGPYPFEPSETAATKFYGDVWVLAGGLGSGGIAILNATTGKQLALRRVDEGFMVAVSPDRVAITLGGTEPGKVLVLDRTGKLVTEIPSRRCH